MSEKIKVLFITHDASRSGAPLLLLNYIKWLKAFELVEPFIYIVRNDVLTPEFAMLGKVIIPFSPKNSIGKNIFYKCYVRLYNSPFYKKVYNFILRRNIKSFNLDLIYSNTICNGKEMEYFNFLKVNQICHVHEGEKGIEIWGKENFLLVKKNTTNYIACSNFVKSNLINKYFVESERIHLIYSSVSKSYFNQALINKHKGKYEVGLKQKNIIGGSGGLGYGKGTDLIVPLMKKILEYRKDIKFLWVGGKKNSSGFKALQEDIANNYLRDYIEVISSVQNPVDYYLDFNIFILLSREDSFPLVCLENAIIGNSVLCFESSGGTPELLSGWKDNIIPFIDIEKMAMRILYLLDNPKINEEIGLSLQQSVIEKYTSDICFPMMLDVLKSNIKR